MCAKVWAGKNKNRPVSGFFTKITYVQVMNFIPVKVSTLYIVGKFKYYPLRRIGSTNAPRYYPRGVASSTLRHYAPSQPPLVKRSRRHHIINRRQNGANRRL
jgi:hypothetical protein